MTSDKILRGDGTDAANLDLQQGSVDASFGSDLESHAASIESSSHVGSSSQFDSTRHTPTRDGDSGSGFKIAQREHQAVMIWKMIVMSAMVLITIGVSIAVFVYVDSKEYEAFATNLEEDTFKIFSDLGGGIVERFSQLDHLAIDMLSYANTSGSEWPYVTLPNYAVRASKARRSTGALAMETFYYITDTSSSLVADKGRQDWESYTREHGKAWTQRALALQEIDDAYMGEQATSEEVVDVEHSGIWYGKEVVPPSSGPYTPSWQAYPIAPASGPVYNWNAIMDPLLGPGIEYAATRKEAVVTQALNLASLEHSAGAKYAAKHAAEWAADLIDPEADPEEPMVRFLYPILETASISSGLAPASQDEATVVALASSSFFFGSLLSGVLPEGQDGLVVVIENDCGDDLMSQIFTYEINGGNATYLGLSDLHDPNFSGDGIAANFTDLSKYKSEGDFDQYSGLPIASSYCFWSITVYPSETMEKKYRSSDPIIFTYSVILIFLITSVCFLGYDKLVADRQQKVLKSAQKSNAIISSLFPSNIRDRLFVEGGGDIEGSYAFQPNKARLKNFLDDTDDPSNSAGGVGASKPIADLFTDCTVMFADIANFTAWSSVRDPSQVFTLLETLYGAFDQIAARRGVFKVETIGDSYVAVAGLPEPRKDHAEVMIKFARDCREQCIDVCHQLEVSLGPETGDLRLRFGLHSGPVTAGVLRGEKSRFQLFGDTVNTAARMESTGVVGKIQVSQATADLLIDRKKNYWLSPRKDKVEAKGKGLMQTYFAEPGGTFASASGKAQNHVEILDTKTERLVSWNVAVLSRLLSQVIQCREHQQGRKRGHSITKPSIVEWSVPQDKMVLDEVKEIIELPEFTASSGAHQDAADVEEDLKKQLYEYVSEIALTYRDNPFHNFEHASHVCMSVAKLLTRIMTPDQVYDHEQRDSRILSSTLHDFTYGITSDPLISFACVFSALIHDSDHPGVPNIQLVKENSPNCQLYKGKSIAEQNSVNVSWDLLLQPKYARLRSAICQTKDEEIRFRQLVVNAVMATDVMDKDLKALRDKRWKKAFEEQSIAIDNIEVEESEYDDDVPERARREASNRRATVIIEHLIQASDVAHTMQHWHIYRKWNERLFREMHKAFMEGRADKDPVDFWYQGEIGFFDYYIIPLAKKLSECGVFGVSSDEYLNYALMNRNEWEKKGSGIVEDMLARMAEEAAAVSLDSMERETSISTDSTKESSHNSSDPK